MCLLLFFVQLINKKKCSFSYLNSFPIFFLQLLTHKQWEGSALYYVFKSYAIALDCCVYKDKKFENASAWGFIFWFKSCNIWLQSKADAFEYADQVLERWYPTVEEGSNKGIVVLVTSQKEGAVTGGPAFVQAVGESILDATVAENLPGNLAFISHP